MKLFAVVALGGGLGWANRDRLGLPSLMADQRTTTGERRTLHPGDGSQIQLNTASAIDYRYSQSVRSLRLIEGEVAIETGHDPRPLRISTRDGVLQTLNAQLLVRERPEGTLLAVRQGAVTLTAQNGQALRVAQPGEQWLFTSGGQWRSAIGHSDPWGWSEGVLSVQRMPLGEFIAELSRYRPGGIRCSEAVAALPVLGTYQLADTDQILALVAASLPIRVGYRTRYWVSVSPV